MYADWKEIIFTFALFKDRGVAQLASVLAWGASGRQFESDHSDKQYIGFQVSPESLFSFQENKKVFTIEF